MIAFCYLEEQEVKKSICDSFHSIILNNNVKSDHEVLQNPTVPFEVGMGFWLEISVCLSPSP